jgi:hypothetical protein
MSTITTLATGVFGGTIVACRYHARMLSNCFRSRTGGRVVLLRHSSYLLVICS